jgi:hypothetical protein
MQPMQGAGNRRRKPRFCAGAAMPAQSISLSMIAVALRE